MPLFPPLWAIRLLTVDRRRNNLNWSSLWGIYRIFYGCNQYTIQLKYLVFKRFVCCVATNPENGREPNCHNKFEWIIFLYTHCMGVPLRHSAWMASSCRETMTAYLSLANRHPQTPVFHSPNMDLAATIGKGGRRRWIEKWMEVIHIFDHLDGGNRVDRLLFYTFMLLPKFCCPFLPRNVVVVAPFVARICAMRWKIIHANQTYISYVRKYLMAGGGRGRP